MIRELLTAAGAAAILAMVIITFGLWAGVATGSI